MGERCSVNIKTTHQETYIIKAGYIEVTKNHTQHVPKSFELRFYRVPAKDHVFEILMQNDKFSA